MSLCSAEIKPLTPEFRLFKNFKGLFFFLQKNQQMIWRWVKGQWWGQTESERGTEGRADRRRRGRERGGREEGGGRRDGGVNGSVSSVQVSLLRVVCPNTLLSPYLLPLSSSADTVCLDCRSPFLSLLSSISSFIITTPPPAAAAQPYATSAKGDSAKPFAVRLYWRAATNNYIQHPLIWHFNH